MKKVFILLLVTAIIVVIGLSVAFRRMPAWIEKGMEQYLAREVSIGKINHVFPLDFRIQDVVVHEGQPWDGEVSLQIHEANFCIEPLALFQGKIHIQELTLAHPEINMRKHRRRIYHVLRSPKSPEQVNKDAKMLEGDSSSTQSASVNGDEDAKKPFFSLKIDQVTISNGVFRFFDYDIARDGFAIITQSVSANMKDLEYPPTTKSLKFEVLGQIPQGRNMPPAQIQLNGWYHLLTQDMSNNLNLYQLWIPYFMPYYQQLTKSSIRDGVLDMQSSTVVRDHDWTSNARVHIRRLTFGSYEKGGQIMGFDASIITDILRNIDGSLDLDIILRWNRSNAQETFHQALARSLRHSIKSTFQLNLDNVVQNTLQKLTTEGPAFIKQDWKNIIKKGDVGEVLSDLLQ